MSNQHSVFSNGMIHHWIKESLSKITTLIVVIWFASFMTACSDHQGGGVAGNGGEKIEDFPQGPQLPVELSRIYTNKKMGISFEYSTQWNLIESPDQNQVTLNNLGLVEKGKESEIKFELLSQLDGQKIQDIEDLKNILQKRSAEVKWKESQFLGGKKGYWHQKVDPKNQTRTAEYYILDQNRNILMITLQTRINFQEDLILTQIIANLSIDFLPPVVEKIWFNQKQVRPGQTITLFIQATDDISGINVAEIGSSQELPQFEYNNWRSDGNLSFMGYNVTTLPESKRNEPFEDPDSEFIHKEFTTIHSPNATKSVFFSIPKKFRQIDEKTFAYDFKVPAQAMDGKIYLWRVAIFDRKGNRAVLMQNYLKEMNGDEKYQFSTKLELAFNVYQEKRFIQVGLKSAATSPNLQALQKPIDLASFEIVREKDDPLADVTPPQIIDAYFEHSLLFEGTGKQKLFLEIQDDSPLLSEAGVMVSNLQDDPYLFPESFSLKKVKDHLYVIEFENRYFFPESSSLEIEHKSRKYQLLTINSAKNEGKNPYLFHLRFLSIHDVAGNSTFVFNGPTDNPLFEIYPDFSKWSEDERRYIGEESQKK